MYSMPYYTYGSTANSSFLEPIEISMGDNCGEWVESGGVVSWCGYQEVGVVRMYRCR